MRVGCARHESLVSVVHPGIEEGRNGLSVPRRRNGGSGVEQRRSGGPKLIVEIRLAPAHARIGSRIVVFPDRVQAHQNGGGRRLESREIRRARRAANLGAARPVGRRRTGRIRNTLGQRDTAAVGSDRPVALGAVFDPIHQALIVVA